jgi:ubiquinone/menaquinone biosynthesis C-methylase UbiE
MSTHEDDMHEHDAVVRRSFERQTGLFSRSDSPFAVSRELAPAWLEPLATDMIVLDVACGAGHVAEGVAPHVRQVVGVDLTPSLLALGASRLADAGVGNVLLQEANAVSLPFADGSFDLVYCRSSLYHLADPQQAIAEMVRTCRLGGRVVLSDLVAPSAEVRDTFDHLHQLIDPSHRRAFLDDEVVDLLASHITPSRRETSAPRLPVDIALTDQSATETVLAALRRELEGGEPTGFDPTDEDGTIVVAFPTAIVQGTRA